MISASFIFMLFSKFLTAISPGSETSLLDIPRVSRLCILSNASPARILSDSDSSCKEAVNNAATALLA